MELQPGDRVLIIRPEQRGDVRAKATTKGQGVVLEVYPAFVLVQMKHFRESFGHDEVMRIGEVRKEAV